MKLKTLYRSIMKVEKKLYKLWKNYESREGSFVYITKAAIDMEYEDENYGLIVDVRWGFYVAEGQNNYQYNRTFYIDVKQFNAMYLEGRMEQIVEGDE